MVLLELERVNCSYGNGPVLRDLSLQVAEGDIVALLGPSGSGKTTVLRAILGFEPVNQGLLRIAGEIVSSADVHLPPERRPVGMVFQDHALFPHLTVAQNIALGIRRESPARQRQTVQNLLELIHLDECGARYPHELSGGQQARVALARALAPRPQLLLLDEPFTELDMALRERLVQEVRGVLKETGATALMVTHDHDEAFAMGDRIGIMMDGELQQWDAPFNIYHRPASRQVARFVGRGVFVPGVLRGVREFETELGVLRSKRTQPHPAGTRMDILLRPDDVILDAEGPIRATVAEKVPRSDDTTLYTLQLESGARLLTLVSSHEQLEVGASARLRLELKHLVAFPASSSDG